MEQIKCDQCGEPVTEDYINRVCAAQLDVLEEISRFGYRGAITCNCCEKCHNSVCRFRDADEDF